MVKVGFICEGETEYQILISSSFGELLSKNKLELISVADAGGNGNLLPKNIQVYCDDMSNGGAEIIFILSDLDADSCVTLTKSRLGECGNSITIISKRQIEAWFLADSKMLTRLMVQDYFFEFPEEENDPYETLRKEFILRTKRGISKNSKLLAAKWFVKNGFSVENAAQHPNCASAKYFVEKLKSLKANS